MKRDGRLYDVTIPYAPHGLFWDALRIGDEMYLKIAKVKHCSWGMVFGILPMHFIIAINGVRIAKFARPMRNGYGH